MITLSIFLIIVSAFILFSLTVMLIATLKIVGVEILKVTILFMLTIIIIGMFFGLIFGISNLQSQIYNNINQTFVLGAIELKQLAFNTNFEQISDWVTKIILGVCLVGTGIISKEFYELVSFLSKREGLDKKEPVIISLTISFLVHGFLFGFLIMRLTLQWQFLG